MRTHCLAGRYPQDKFVFVRLSRLQRRRQAYVELHAAAQRFFAADKPAAVHDLGLEPHGGLGGISRHVQPCDDFRQAGTDRHDPATLMGLRRRRIKAEHGSQLIEVPTVVDRTSLTGAAAKLARYLLCQQLFGSGNAPQYRPVGAVGALGQPGDPVPEAAHLSRLRGQAEARQRRGAQIIR